MPLLKRLAELYRAARLAQLPADAHDILLQHAQELEKALTPKPRKPKADPK